MNPYYDRDGIQIYCGDCRDVLPTLPAGGIDMVFTSPPYNLGNTSGGGFPSAGSPRGHYSSDSPLGRKRGGMGKWVAASESKGLAHGYGAYDDSMPHEEYVAWQKETLLVCWRLLSESGVIYYNHKQRVFNGVLISPFAYIPESLTVRQVIIWARAGGINFSPAFYVPTHEWIVVIAKPAFRLKSKGASGVGDVWRIPQEENKQHPAPFPLALPSRAIETTTAKVILDPFAGIGTTLRAAKDFGRKAIGIEIEERYCEIAAKRLDQAVLPFAAVDSESPASQAIFEGF